MSVLLGTNSIDWEEFLGCDWSEDLFENIAITVEECFDELGLDILRYYEKWYSPDSLLVILGYQDDFNGIEAGGMITNELGDLFDFFTNDTTYLYQWGNELLVRTIENGRNIYYIPHIIAPEEVLKFNKMESGSYSIMNSNDRRKINTFFFYACSKPFFYNELLVEDNGADINKLL